MFLGERLAARRIAAVLMALIGAAIILRPGFSEVELGHVAMLVAAIVFAGSYLLAKVLADEAKPGVVVAMLSIFVTLGLAPFAAADWVQPGLTDLGLLFLAACFATAGHYTMTLAFAAAPVTLPQPVTFLQLVLAILHGALVCTEPVAVRLTVGVAEIIS